MPPTCRTCRSPKRPDIDKALLSGVPMRNMVERFGTSLGALSRHRHHVGAAIVRAAEKRGEHLDETLLEKVERLEADARRLGERAESEGDLRAALVAVDKLMDVAKLLREMTSAAPAEVSIVLSWGDAAQPAPAAVEAVLPKAEGSEP